MAVVRASGRLPVKRQGVTPVDESEPEARGPWARLALRVGLLVAAVVVMHTLIDWVMKKTAEAENMPLMMGVLAAVLLIYVVLMATPFAPGIEIGISLLVLKGAAIAPFVYLATVLGLSLAFLAGRFLPYAWLHALFHDLRLKTACRLMERLAPLSREERLDLLAERVPPALRPVIGSGRYLLLGVLLNVPGNFVLGGGGGLAFVAGVSRLYATAGAIAIMALAVLPVPFIVWLYGSDVLVTE